MSYSKLCTHSGGGLILFTLVSASLVFPMIWQRGHSCPLRFAPVAAVSPIVASTTIRRAGGLNFRPKAERQKHVSALIGALATGCEAPGLYGKKSWIILEVVSKLQIRPKSKAQADEKAQHTR
jgi:hypothetical protein